MPELKTATDNLGVITFLMMKSPVFRPMTLEAIRNITVPAIHHKLAVTASMPAEREGAQPQPLAFALFAKVNDTWDEMLRDPGFELADMPSEAWASGGNKWLVELLSLQKASGAFVEQAARAVFPNGGTLHVRVRNATGVTEIGKRRF